MLMLFRRTRDEEEFRVTWRRVIRARDFFEKRKMKAVLLDWHVGCVHGSNLLTQETLRCLSTWYRQKDFFSSKVGGVTEGDQG